MPENNTILMPELFASLANGFSDPKISANQGLTKTKQDFSDLLQDIESGNTGSEVAGLPVSVPVPVSEGPVNTGKTVPLVMQSASATSLNPQNSDIDNRMPAPKRMNSAEHSIVQQQSLGNQNTAASFDQGVQKLSASDQEILTGDRVNRALSEAGSVAKSPDYQAATFDSNSDSAKLNSTSSSHDVMSSPISTTTIDSLTPIVNGQVTDAEISGEHTTSEIVVKSSVIDEPLAGMKLETKPGNSPVVQPGMESMLSGDQSGKDSSSQMNVIPENTVPEDATVKSQSAINPVSIHHKNIMNGQDVQTQAVTRPTSSASSTPGSIDPDVQNSADEMLDDSTNEIEFPDQLFNKSTQIESKGLNVESETSQNQLKQYQLYASPDKLIENAMTEHSPVLHTNISTPAPSSLSTSTLLPPLQLDKPLADPAWSDELGEQIKWISKQQMQTAEIRLNPAHLGSMEVKIQMQNEQAHIQFTAMNTTVKEALEHAIPRLREMMESNGVQLANVDIAEQAKSQAGQQNFDHSSDNHKFQTKNHVDNMEQESALTEGVFITPIKSTSSLDLFV